MIRRSEVLSPEVLGAVVEHDDRAAQRAPAALVAELHWRLVHESDRAKLPVLEAGTKRRRLGRLLGLRAELGNCQYADTLRWRLAGAAAAALSAFAAGGRRRRA